MFWSYQVLFIAVSDVVAVGKGGEMNLFSSRYLKIF